MGIEDKIQALNYAKEKLESAINEIEDIKEFEEYCKRWQEDINEIDTEISDLEEQQQEQWNSEQRELEMEYERSVM